MTDVLEHLNEAFQKSIRRRDYGVVKTLALYWQDGHQGYRDEGRAISKMFREMLQYPSEEFPIPTANSYSHLLGLITQTLIAIGTAAEKEDTASLLVIHYGGHGDRDDDRHEGQERRSVWAAHRTGEPTLPWYRIQDQLCDIMVSNTDILLVLDCCFAAQAGRSRDKHAGRFEILAASAMGMETPAPGSTSFTSILIAEMTKALRVQGHIDVSELHGQMCHRSTQLWATPVHMLLKPAQGSLKLRPLSQDCDPKCDNYHTEKSDSSFLHLLIEVDSDLSPYHADEIGRWLGADTPRIVSKVVFQTTTKLGRAVGNIQEGSSTISAHLDGCAKEDIMLAWNNLVELVERYHAKEHGQTFQRHVSSSKSQRAYDFLRELDMNNDTVRNTIQRNLLCAPDIDIDTAAIDEAAGNEIFAELSLADQFRMRRMISQSESSQVPITNSFLPDTDTEQSFFVIEEKRYSPYIDPAELPGLVARVTLLADLLRAPKDPAFRSLRCLKWEHKVLETKFLLHLAIPAGYEPSGNNHETLYSVISTIKSSLRPSLDNRMTMALALATAVQKWHSVGWVHQGISSHNIIFFKSKETGQLDYNHPYLLGFEFSRPHSDPSIGRAVDDLEFGVYRHPSRQGNARKGHRKIHDLYSLGVVLLEIGLWQTAIDMIPRIQKKPDRPEDIQKVLQKAGSGRIAHYAGESYRSAVCACLTSAFDVDEDNDKESNLARAFERKVVQKIMKGISFA